MGRRCCEKGRPRYGRRKKERIITEGAEIGKEKRKDYHRGHRGSAEVTESLRTCSMAGERGRGILRLRGPTRQNAARKKVGPLGSG